jgi:hypothetical protein
MFAGCCSTSVSIHAKCASLAVTEIIKGELDLRVEQLEAIKSQLAELKTVGIC